MSKRGRSRLIWLFCLLAGANLSQAQTTAVKAPPVRHEFSLQQAADYAKQNNVQVKNALLGVQIQQQTNRDITSAALPNITGSIQATDYLQIPTSLLPGEVFGQPAGTYIPVQFGTKYNSTASVQLQQLLFDGQVFIGLQARATSIEWQKKSVEVTEQNIKSNIYKIYYQLVVSKTQIELLDSNITRLQKLQHDAGELYKNGFAEKLDVDKVNVQLANLQTEKTKALNSIDIGYLGLKTLLGMPVKDTLILTDKITDDQVKKDLLTDAPYQYADRPDYQYLQLGRKLNEFNIRRYKLSYIPTVALTGVYSKNAQRNKFDFFGKGDWFTTSYIGLNISIPIFDGFSKDAKIKKAKLELQQTENQLAGMELNIDNEVAQAKINYQSAVVTMDYQKKNMQLAETVYYQTKKKFEVGTGSNTEITAAQLDLKTAQTNYINALYSAIIASVDYQKAIGKL
ncbi:TolC family protein [Sediminibacterium ginsengisoli]|uniref:Outer membrane protein TolC n=1 Tax=Sediminibacterium ginsengisoli TaxID=413434 RepID=A0A1T4RHA3_9BACT|nr:TolC family protein [Sediminibacterium ginsengisoli]SKA15299.1 Outer membrane protein TolC [Sediminibacterium ginsengisoli]